MNETRRRSSHLLAAVVAVILVFAIDGLTNRIDASQFTWDFRYYLGMARDGFAARTASPFAYRYLTPLIAGLLSRILHMPVESGFVWLSYAGAILQLGAVFALAQWYGGTVRGAWVAMLAAGFSLFQVKFLLFDPFRPDLLAYPLIILQCYLALTRRYGLLLAATIIGCQIREFNSIPLIAYLITSARFSSAGVEDRRMWLTRAVVGVTGLGIALIVPRLLIPVSGDFQFVSLTRDGILRGLLAPLLLARDANFLYTLAAYVLPLLFLAAPRGLMRAWCDIRGPDRNYLAVYSLMVMAFSFLGGTDFFRFATFLLVPQTILLARLARERKTLTLVLMLAAVFVFNRVWMHFPISSEDAYLDFYGGYGTRFNGSSVARLIELISWIALGTLVRRFVREDHELSAPVVP